MQKGIKFRIYPNKEQQNIIHQTLGCCRLIYNKGLAMRNEAYEKGDKVGYSQTSAMLTGLKKSDDFAFLKVVDSIALQQSLRDLDRGFVNFFQKRASHPTFKSKHNRHQSYRKEEVKMYSQSMTSKCKVIALCPAVELSYLSEEEQSDLYETIKSEDFSFKI